MDRVTDISQLYGFVKAIRNLRRGFITNFYIDDDKHDVWIKNGTFMYQQWDDTVFLFNEHYSSDGTKAFTNLFYISTTEDSVVKHLCECKNFYHMTYILDIIGWDIMCKSIVEKLKQVNAIQLAVLNRMVRVGKVSIDSIIQCNENVGYAQSEDLDVIRNLLYTHFDEQLEQLPLLTELRKMINQQHILTYKQSDKILGIVLFDLNATTLYLRYWLTLLEFRGKGVGSALFKQFMIEGKETKRQILWVRQDNKNAIVRYKHYGFKQENMYDYILKL